MENKIHGLPSSEKLKSKKAIGQIFQEKTSVFKFPLNCLYQKDPDNVLPKITSVASKRNFKRAVDRNIIKRRIREAYRLNKDILTNQSESRKLNLVFIYVAKEIMSFQEIEKSMVHILSTVSKK
jgi:ribonuclease P protein component